MIEIKNCSICDKVSQAMEGRGGFLIKEFRHSIFVVGDHQFFNGYSLILLKTHVRELHQLAPRVQQGLFRELMLATNALVRAFKPWKMNHACYGNLVPHLHWHLIPRYESETDHQSQPWLHADRFSEHLIDSRQARAISTKIKAHLPVVEGRVKKSA